MLYVGTIHKMNDRAKWTATSRNLMQVINDQEFYDDVISYAPHMDLTLLVMPTRRLPLEHTVRCNSC